MDVKICAVLKSFLNFFLLSSEDKNIIFSFNQETCAKFVLGRIEGKYQFDCFNRLLWHSLVLPMSTKTMKELRTEVNNAQHIKKNVYC